MQQKLSQITLNTVCEFIGYKKNAINSVQATTAIVDTVIVESTAIVEQKPLTTQFYLLLVESPL